MRSSRILWLVVVLNAGCGSVTSEHAPTASSAPASSTVPSSSIATPATSSSTPVAESSVPVRPGVLASLERTACYGLCPVYVVTVFDDGRVEYEGKDFVKTKGKVTSKLDASKLDALRSAFKDTDFFSLGDYSYNPKTDPTDGPGASLYYASGGRAHAVQHYSGSHAAPDSLGKLEDTIDSLVGVEALTGTDAERLELSRQGKL